MQACYSLLMLDRSQPHDQEDKQLMLYTVLSAFCGGRGGGGEIVFSDPIMFINTYLCLLLLVRRERLREMKLKIIAQL